jgi:ubiquinone/menaquinone biosynthesis C-methylase UbiE
MTTVDFGSIDRGFSAKALVYDDYNTDHPIIQWSRGLVREHIMTLVPPGSSLLELAAGTGADAAFLAERGYRVHATDLAQGMVAEMRRKIAARGLGDRMTSQRVSFTEPDLVTGGPYDLVFSTFGGLNCIPDLTAMTRGLPRLLKPRGFVTLVVMPPVCPWEMGQALRGDFKTAFRRLSRGGVMARVASAHFKTYYFRPAQVLRALGPGFRKIAVRGLCVFSPPSWLDRFARSHATLYRRLTRIDERLGGWPLLNGMGDYVLVTAQKRDGAS